MCNKKSKRCLTLDYNLCELATEKAKKMGLSFSSYLNLIMYNDIYEVKNNAINEVVEDPKPKKNEDFGGEFNNGLSDSKNEEMIDNILNMEVF